MRKDLRADGARCEVGRHGHERKTGGRVERFVHLLRGDARKDQRRESWRLDDAVRQESDVAGGCVDRVERRMERPLRSAGDLFAAERDVAAHGTASEERVSAAYLDRRFKVHDQLAINHYACRVEEEAVSSSRCAEAAPSSSRAERPWCTIRCRKNISTRMPPKVTTMVAPVGVSSSTLR